MSATILPSIRRTRQLLSGFPFSCSLSFPFAALLSLPGLCQAQNLQVTYGTKGVQTVAFGATVLEDTSANPGDTFHIWHMKSTDLQGNVVGAGQYGWGESKDGERWDAATQTETYTFSWGSISTQFVQQGNNLNVVVTEVNNAGSGIIFDGAEIYPFTLHFPQEPAAFYGYSQYAITSTGPGVSPADFGSGIVTAVLPDESVPMYTGWKSAGNASYSPLMTSTAPDGLASFLPQSDRPVPPGSSFTFTLSLRFTPEGTSASAGDAYSSFAATYPSQMTWTDKRIIGTAYLASSPPGGGDITQPGGFPTNPRRYFNDPSVDITSSTGLRAFQDRILAQAASNVTNTLAMQGQGVITWDLEGEQYPQNTSYVCSPDQIAAVAPEMESSVLNPASGFFGRRLDDAYFATMTGAGLRVGVCLRPQVFNLAPNGTASQSFLTSNTAIIATLENKATFANARWGVTLFYVDSTVDPNGGTLDPAIFQQLITDLPAFLFIPEESTPRYYAYSAPFYSFLFHTTVGTPASTYAFYPRAFGANLVNDVAPATLAAFQAPLTQAVAAGDILMGHADYWQDNDPTLVSIYQAAGVSSPAPVQVAPAINWPAPTAISYGTPLSGAQLNASASTTGSFLYTPSAGTVLAAGSTTLLATFTPADTRDYKSTTASVSLTVAPARPVVTWAAPAPVPFGTALGSTQLNAIGNVAGTFSYSPSAGTVPQVGLSTLTGIFTPTDTVDYLPVSSTVTLTVTAPSQTNPTLSWSAPQSILYGTALSGLQLNATANVPGTFTYSPVSGTILSAGTRTLLTTFIPSDASSYRTVSTSVRITISRAKPTIAWSTPAAVGYGQPLSALQLNARSDVPGTFTYFPALGTILGAGSHTLSATFTPADKADYLTVMTKTVLKVNPTPKH